MTDIELEQAIMRGLAKWRHAPAAILISERTGAPPQQVEEALSRMRTAGRVRCSNKGWYRSDKPVAPPEPKAPRLTAEEAKRLERQGRMF